jgi:lipopolysaccharide transport system permease protein
MKTPENSSYLKIIRPGYGSYVEYLSSLYATRELLFDFTIRSIKIRYKQTYLGICWAVIQPLFTMIIFTFLFGNLISTPSDELPYPIFSYTGLILWAYISTSLSSGGGSLVTNSQLLTKIYFPRFILPAAPCIAAFMDYCISLLVLIPLFLYYGITSSYKILLLPFVLAVSFLLVCGAGCIFASIAVKYRDVQYLLPVLIQFLMFLSPVIYPMSVIPENLKWLYSLNPLAGLLTAHRACLVDQIPFDWYSFGAATIISLIIFTFGIYYIRKHEQDFADLV